MTVDRDAIRELGRVARSREKTAGVSFRGFRNFFGRGANPMAGAAAAGPQASRVRATYAGPAGPGPAARGPLGLGAVGPRPGAGPGPGAAAGSGPMGSGPTVANPGAFQSPSNWRRYMAQGGLTAGLGYGLGVGAPGFMAAQFSSPDDLAWHRQAAMGYGHGVTGEGILPRLQRAGYGLATSLLNPGRTLASLYAGDGPMARLSNPSFAEAKFDPTTGRYTGITAERELSPYARDLMTDYENSGAKLDALRRAQVDRLHTAESDLDTGNYGGGFGTAVAMRRAQEARIDAMRRQLGQGHYGGGFWGGDAAYHKNRLATLKQQLQAAGLLQPPSPQAEAASELQRLPESW